MDALQGGDSLPLSAHDDDWVESVLAYWFAELGRSDWFRKDPALDAEIAARFGALYDRLAMCSWQPLPKAARTVLAGIIVLDQFPRNMFRDTSRAFATDAAALRLAEHALAKKLDRDLSNDERQFLYMPFQHSEDASLQVLSVDLFTQIGRPQSAVRHKAVIDRFGRFPHRNAALQRTSTPAELAFLDEPGSGF